MKPQPIRDNFIQNMSEQTSVLSNARKKLTRNLKWVFKNVIWVAVCALCSIIMCFFIHKTFTEYAQNNPITIVTFVDQPMKPDPVIITLCNNIFFDEEKILNYNGSDYDEDSITFLKQMVLMNDSFDHRTWVRSAPFGDVFLLSPRILDHFKLDLNKIMITCFKLGNFTDCSTDFEFVLDYFSSCYRARINIQGFGTNSALALAFYLNSEFRFGKYSGYPKISVSIHHPDDYVSPLEGFAISANDYVIVTATTEEKTQEISFGKAKCTHQEKIEYNSTGQIRSVPYQSRKCGDLCFVEVLYLQCKCSFNNPFETNAPDCLEKSEDRKCLLEAFYEGNILEELSRNCISKCSPRCRKKA